MFNPWVRKIPWRQKWQPSPVFLPRESHGQRSLAGYSLSSVQSLSHVRLFATPWTVAHQPPPSMGFSRQEYWSGLTFPSPGDLPSAGIEPPSLAMEVDSLPTELQGKKLPNSSQLSCITFQSSQQWTRVLVDLYPF